MGVNMPANNGGKGIEALGTILTGVKTLHDMGLLSDKTASDIALQHEQTTKAKRENINAADRSVSDSSQSLLAQERNHAAVDAYASNGYISPERASKLHSLISTQSGSQLDFDKEGGSLEKFIATEQSARASKSLAADKRQSEKKLPADKVMSLSEASTIPKVMDDLRVSLSSNKDIFGPVGGNIAALNPYNETAQTIDAQFRTGSQIFGRYMEGGVLRKEDEEKYRKMFPKLGDTPEVAQNKLDLADRIFSRRYASDIESLKSSGYNSSGLAGNVRSAPSLPGAVTKKAGVIVPTANASDAVGPPSNMTFEQFRAWKSKNGSIK